MPIVIKGALLALKTILLKLAAKALSEPLLEWVIFQALEAVARKTTNKIDDEGVERLKKAYFGEKQ